MLAALDLGPLGTLAIVFAIVVTFLIIKAARTQNQQPGLRRSARPPAMPRVAQRSVPLHTRHPALPAEDVDSDEAEDVARQLAPQFVEMAHAQTLVTPEDEPAPKVDTLDLRNPLEARRAFILKEVFGKPRALRR